MGKQDHRPAGRAGRAAGILRALAALALALALWHAPAGAAAETAAETVTGYFTETVHLRPEPEQSGTVVDFIPAYTAVTLEKTDANWAKYTSPAGKTGYVRYAKLLPVPDYKSDPERYVYSDKRIEVRGLPFYQASTVYTAPPFELLTVNGHRGGFLHVVAEDGTEGYIMKNWAKKAEFRPKRLSPTTLCAVEEAPLLDMPLSGAHRMGTLAPDRLVPAEGHYGDYYALRVDGELRYVEKSRMIICSCRGGESRIFFKLPRGGRAGREGTIEEIYLPGAVRSEGAVLVRADGTEEALAEGETVFVHAACGQWYGAVRGADAGYLAREDVEILDGEALQARLAEKDLGGASVRRSVFLDRAFTLVEEGNPFLARYNLLTGAGVRSLFRLGVPYFWGGRNYRTMTLRLPRYTVREAWQSSRVYYQRGTEYLYGLDCIGFVKTVYRLAGKPIAGTVTGHRDAVFCEAGEHIYCDDVHPLPEDWTEAARTMRAGDIMIIHHPGTHAMMYMGTLREFGYTEEQLPALAKYLDHPLMLQSGENPWIYQRFQSLIATGADRAAAGATPPDGGVGVCILGVDPADAEMTVTCHESTKGCFDVEGSCVTIMGFGNVSDYFVWRMGREDLVPAAAGEGDAEETEFGEEEEGTGTGPAEEGAGTGLAEPPAEEGAGTESAEPPAAESGLPDGTSPEPDAGGRAPESAPGQ